MSKLHDLLTKATEHNNSTTERGEALTCIEKALEDWVRKGYSIEEKHRLLEVGGYILGQMYNFYASRVGHILFTDEFSDIAKDLDSARVMRVIFVRINCAAKELEHLAGDLWARRINGEFKPSSPQDN